MVSYDPFAALGGIMMIYVILIVVFVVVCVLGLIIAIWVYSDAKKRDMNATVWLLIVLLTGGIGCIIYLIVRD